MDSSGEKVFCKLCKSKPIFELKKCRITEHINSPRHQQRVIQFRKNHLITASEDNSTAIQSESKVSIDELCALIVHLNLSPEVGFIIPKSSTIRSKINVVGVEKREGVH